MGRSIERVREFFRAQHVEIEVRELPTSTRTAQLAAEAVGAQLGQIVKSLLFIADERTPVLALVAGDRRADPAKIARAANAGAARLANADEVRRHTGYAIGGVAPVAHPDGAISVILLDAALLRFATLWAAAGAPHAVFPVQREKLLELTGARIADIVTP